MFKLFIVEDDPKLRDLLFENTSKWGFEVACCQDFSDVLSEFSKWSPHLVLMDINLPNFDGFYWCSKIRELSKLPIIFLSSRNSNMDIDMAINMGGDDFISKPFSLEVLMVKINALIRRSYSYSNSDTSVLEHNKVVLNLNDNSLSYMNSKVDLTRNEFKILSLLMKENGNVISRDKIMRSLWEDESFIDDNTLTVNINRLRKKLEDIELVDYIKTRKGQGYIIV
jgi:DNA-binding response OmpR family regulator